MLKNNHHKRQTGSHAARKVSWLCHLYPWYYLSFYVLSSALGVVSFAGSSHKSFDLFALPSSSLHLLIRFGPFSSPSVSLRPGFCRFHNTKDIIICLFPEYTFCVNTALCSVSAEKVLAKFRGPKMEATATGLDVDWQRLLVWGFSRLVACYFLNFQHVCLRLGAFLLPAPARLKDSQDRQDKGVSEYLSVSWQKATLTLLQGSRSCLYLAKSMLTLSSTHISFLRRVSSMCKGVKVSFEPFCVSYAHNFAPRTDTATVRVYTQRKKLSMKSESNSKGFPY